MFTLFSDRFFDEFFEEAFKDFGTTMKAIEGKDEKKEECKEVSKCSCKENKPIMNWEYGKGGNAKMSMYTGMIPENVQVVLDKKNRIVTVKGEETNEYSDDENRHYGKCSKSFTRCFHVPDDININTVSLDRNGKNLVFNALKAKENEECDIVNL